MDLTLAVGNTATFFTILSSFSGLPICLDILKRKSTTGVSCLPFLASVINGSLWLHYGITVKDSVVTFVNSIALFLQICYLIIYYYASSDKAALTKMWVPIIALLLSIHAYSFYTVNRERAAGLLGFLSCCGSIGVSAAPLEAIREVFKTKSTASLPFLIILGVFTYSFLWFFYGLLVNDSYIQVPNFIASALSGFQLGLFVVFDSKKAHKKSH